MTGVPLPEGVLRTRLRPLRDSDTEVMVSWRALACSPYEDWRGDEPEATQLLAPPGGGDLVVTDSEDRPIGTVSWHPVLYGPNLGSQALDIGISLQPWAQGLGHGARAQRMLASYLFATTDTHRVQASTDVANVAEQRSLERAGFRPEGVLRGAQWRQGCWHDLVSYARLREDD